MKSKKLLSLLMTLVMTIGLSLPVNAATITAPEVVYQGENITATIVCDNGAGNIATVNWTVNGVTYTTPADKIDGVWKSTLNIKNPEVGTYEIDANVIKYKGNDEFHSKEDAEIVAVNVTNRDTTAPDTTAPELKWNDNNPKPNSYGWYNTSVNLGFSLSDPSGVDAIRSTQGPLVFDAEGSNQTKTIEAYDLATPANHTTYTSPVVNIDKTVPIINGRVDRGANSADWYNDNVIVSFIAEDALSGVASSTAPVTLSEGESQSVIGTAVDKAGNIASTTVSGINIDKTAPTINIENGGTYTLNQKLTWSAEDALSGLATAASGIIDTSKVGIKTQTITATDNAGNTKEVTITYTVKYDFGGILQPINANGSSIFKAGSTVPVKFQLKDSAGTFISTAVASLSYAKMTDNVFGTDAKAVSTSAATTGSLFRYDSISNQYIFNFSTKGLTAGTYQLTVKLDDTKTYTVQISLK
jgi:hypothetical protein